MAIRLYITHIKAAENLFNFDLSLIKLEYINSTFGVTYREVNLKEQFLKIFAVIPLIYMRNNKSVLRTLRRKSQKRKKKIQEKRRRTHAYRSHLISRSRI